MIFFFLGGVSFVFEGCSEDICTFLFFILDTLSFCTPVLWPFIDNIHCTFISYIYIYDDDVCCYSPISPCVCVCVFLSLSLNTCFFMYAILYFCFTLRYLDEFCFKYFKKTGCQNLSCHELFSCKFFQEFVLGLDFIVLNKWLWV